MLYRPLLLSSVAADLAAVRGISVRLIGLLCLVAIAIAVSLSAMTIGAILTTALLIGPAAIGLRLTSRPGLAMAWAAVIGLAATWLGVLLAYDSFYWPPGRHGWPVSFFVVTLIFLGYLLAPARAGPGGRAAGRAGRRTRPGGGGLSHVLRIHDQRLGSGHHRRGRGRRRRLLHRAARRGVRRGRGAAGRVRGRGRGQPARDQHPHRASRRPRWLGALGIGWLGRRGRRDVATALALVVLLGLGALFLSFSTEYAPEIYALLFGEVLGVSTNEILPVAILAALSVAAIIALYRPLLLTSVMPELAEARGIRAGRVETLFLVVVALATSMALPVVGALLIFSLMIGPPAAARSVTSRPLPALLACPPHRGRRGLGVDRRGLRHQLAGRLLRGRARGGLLRRRAGLGRAARRRRRPRRRAQARSGGAPAARLLLCGCDDAGAC